MGDPCAGHKSAIAAWRRFDMEKDSISEENFGFDPPMGSKKRKCIWLSFYPTEDLLKIQGWSPC